MDRAQILDQYRQAAEALGAESMLRAGTINPMSDEDFWRRSGDITDRALDALLALKE